MHEAALNDSGVWVSSDAQAKFARANVPIGQLDTGVATSVAAGSGLDVLQDGAAVVGVGTGAGQLFPIDPRTSTAGDPAATLVTQPPKPRHASPPCPVDLRGGTIALLDRESGKVWAQRVDARAGITGGLAELSPSAKPVADDRQGRRDRGRRVGHRARRLGRRRQGHLRAGRRGAKFGPPDRRRRPRCASQSPDLTAVGTTWVAYDAAKDRVYTASEPDGFDAQVTTAGRPALRRAPAARARTPTRSPSPARERAVLVPLDGGVSPGGVARARSGSTGCPAARSSPARSCSAAACTPRGPRPARSSTAPTAAAPATSPPRRCPPRASRRPATASPSGSTAAWSCSTTSTTAASGTSTTSRPRSTTGTPSSRRPAPTTKNKKKDENLVDEASLDQPPKAEPDDAAVRPGRTSKLHVLDNDTDVAGSVLSIDQADVTPPDASRASRRRCRPTARPSTSPCPRRPRASSFTFGYRVNNGKVKGKGEAKVTVRVVARLGQRPAEAAPGRRRSSPRTAYPVIAGKRLSVPVLADWRDPESDILAARAATEGGVVDGQGRITLLAPHEGRQAADPLPRHRRARRHDQGRRHRPGHRHHRQQVRRAARPSRMPCAASSASRCRSSRSATTSPAPTPASRMPCCGCAPRCARSGRSTSTPTSSTGQVTVTGSAPGTYELTYSAQTGAGAAPGRVRVDLVAPPEGAPPVAVPDTATLHDQAPVMVDVARQRLRPER